MLVIRNLFQICGKNTDDGESIVNGVNSKYVKDDTG